MLYLILLYLVSVYVRVSFGGALEVVDYNGQCLIWSDDNHGCTGYSAYFGLLDGKDCSRLSDVLNGTRRDEFVLKVDPCGIEHGQPTAWIAVNTNGRVTFFNQNGDQLACTLDSGLKVGSKCNATSSGYTTSSFSSSLSSDPGSISSILGPPAPPPRSSPTPSLSSRDQTQTSSSASTLHSLDCPGAEYIWIESE